MLSSQSMAYAIEGHHSSRDLDMTDSNRPDASLEIMKHHNMVERPMDHRNRRFGFSGIASRVLTAESA